MEARLPAVCRRARRDAGLSLMDVANRAGMSQSTIWLFEQAHGWRRDTDRIVCAYAAELGIAPVELWRAALDASDPPSMEAG